jgi:hypothetical protein
MSTGSVIDLGPFDPQLPEMACKEAFGSRLALGAGLFLCGWSLPRQALYEIIHHAIELFRIIYE